MASSFARPRCASYIPFQIDYAVPQKSVDKANVNRKFTSSSYHVLSGYINHASRHGIPRHHTQPCQPSHSVGSRVDRILEIQEAPRTAGTRVGRASRVGPPRSANTVAFIPPGRSSVPRPLRNWVEANSEKILVDGADESTVDFSPAKVRFFCDRPSALYWLPGVQTVKDLSYPRVSSPPCSVNGTDTTTTSRTSTLGISSPT